MNCCRCQGPLTERSLNDNPVLHCKNCDGLVVEVKHMEGVMNDLSRQLEEQYDDLKVEVPVQAKDTNAALQCPICGGGMSNDRYLGKVHIDRCSSCFVVFIDGGDETEHAVRAWWQMQGRIKGDRQERIDDIESQGRRMSWVIAVSD